ncbi:MAG TPA: hypothetical protein VI455_13930 [Terriglobia bacterium]
MKNHKSLLGVLLIGVALATLSLKAQQSSPVTVPVHMVCTVEPLNNGDTPGLNLTRQDVQVRQGKNNLQVTDWIPSRGDAASLQLFILIDDTSDTSLGVQLGDLKAFITAQPATTMVGIGYMRNTAVNIVQNFTADHEAAAKAVRLPLGSTGASDSPYLSLMTLLRGWPESKMRREVLMVTDGIDRLRGLNAGRPTGPSPSPSRGRSSGSLQPGFGPTMPARATMPYLSPDVDSASNLAQRSGVIVHSIYTLGVGHVGRNFFEATNGQNGISKLADETGGESFFLGTQMPVGFKPFLDRLQTILDNQYFLVFQAVPGKKPGLQRVKISTEAPKVEIDSADNVWVPTPGQPAGKGK